MSLFHQETLELNSSGERLSLGMFLLIIVNNKRRLQLCLTQRLLNTNKNLSWRRLILMLTEDC